jgi:hypothetical protein
VTATPRAVSRFEARLLQVLRFLLRQGPGGAALPLILSRYPQPKCLSRAAVELIEDTLAKGGPLLLARGGGWRRERYLRAGQVAAGRLWQRSPPEELALSFSAAALQFLVWLTAENAAEWQGAWPLPPLAALTAGDQLLLYFTFASLQATEAAPLLRAQPVFAGHPLCRLAYPGVDFTPAGAVPVPDFLPWTSGVRACILEGLQPELASRWLVVERRKGALRDWQEMQRLGQSQEAVLDACLDAFDRAGRRDLARFLLVTLAELLLPAEPRAGRWLGQLASAGPRLADRVETQRAALVLLRQTERFRQWEQRARGVAFFDEDYAASQLWKAEWERWQGEELHRRALAVLREVEPFQAKKGDS